MHILMYTIEEHSLTTNLIQQKGKGGGGKVLSQSEALQFPHHSTAAIQ